MNDPTPDAPDGSLATLRQQRSDEALRAALAEPDATASLLSFVACTQLAMAAEIAEQIHRTLAVADARAEVLHKLAPEIDRSVRVSRNSALLVKVRDRLLQR